LLLCNKNSIIPLF